VDAAAPAILEAWFPGTEAGDAVADVLFGKVNPGGKLPVSFPRVLGQVPIYYNHEPTGRPCDVTSKYNSRYRDLNSCDPLYAFGFGLSYTTFAVTNLQLSSPMVSRNGSVTATVDVQNTGTRAGDEVVVLPVGSRTQVESLETIDGPLEAAIPPMSVTIRLADDVDVSRGDMLADPSAPPTVARELEARVCWMSDRPLEQRARLAVKHTTRSVRAIAEELVSRIDVHTLDDVPAPERLELNDIGVVRLRLAEPLCVDPYAENRTTGAFVLIDEATNETIGAGMVLSAS